MSNECPYGADYCPKVQTLEAEVTAMKTQLNRIYYLCAFIAGIVAVELGIVII